MKHINFAVTAIIIPPIAGIFAWSQWNNHDSTRQDIARDTRLVALYRQSDSTPYQWKAKEVVYGYNQIRRSILVPRKEKSSLDELRANLQMLEDELQLGVNWKEPIRTFELPVAANPPSIEGKLDVEAWEHALTFHGYYPIDKVIKKDSADKWQVMYTPEHLYFAADFIDSHIEVAKSERLYEGDSFELFVMPEERYHTYVELVLSPDGRKYTKWVSQTKNSPFELSEYNPRSLTTSVRLTSQGYRIEGRIGFCDLPAYLLGNLAKSGEALRIMMIRKDKLPNKTITSLVPVPFLYDGHNIFGYMKIVLQ